MTKYRLKDAALQKKLDEISDGEFSKNLHEFDENHFASYWGKTIFFTINEDDDGEELEESKHIREPQFGVWFNIGEIEEVPEYDPNAWNSFPEVTPPEGVLMLVECIDEDDKTFKTCAEYVEDGHGAYYWRNEYEIDVPVKRFRPLE